MVDVRGRGVGVGRRDLVVAGVACTGMTCFPPLNRWIKDGYSQSLQWLPSHQQNIMSPLLSVSRTLSAGMRTEHFSFG